MNYEDVPLIAFPFIHIYYNYFGFWGEAPINHTIASPTVPRKAAQAPWPPALSVRPTVPQILPDTNIKIFTKYPKRTSS